MNMKALSVAPASTITISISLFLFKLPATTISKVEFSSSLVDAWATQLPSIKDMRTPATGCCNGMPPSCSAVEAAFKAKIS